MNRLFVRGLIALTLLCALTSLASATPVMAPLVTLEQKTYNYGDATPTTWTFDKFDSHLGDLLYVVFNLTSDATIHGYAKLADGVDPATKPNKVAGGATFYLTDTGNFAVAFTSPEAVFISTPTSLPPYSAGYRDLGSISAGMATGKVTYGPDNSLADALANIDGDLNDLSVKVSPTLDLNTYIATSPADQAMVTLSSPSMFSDIDSGVDANFLTSAKFSGSVEYWYDSPDNPTPEPLSYALSGSGLLVLALVGRRRLAR
jgi:hypothetical protein